MLAARVAGAVLGAVLLPRLREQVSTSLVLALASIVFAVATAALALVSSSIVVGVLPVLTGVAWLAVLSTLNAAMQLTVAGWVRAPGLAVYQLVFLGGQGVAASGAACPGHRLARAGPRPRTRCPTGAGIGAGHLPGPRRKRRCLPDGNAPSGSLPATYRRDRLAGVPRRGHTAGVRLGVYPQILGRAPTPARRPRNHPRSGTA